MVILNVACGVCTHRSFIELAGLTDADVIADLGSGRGNVCLQVPRAKTKYLDVGQL